MEQTTNYGLNKPGGSDYARINVLNANMDAVDAALKELEESKAAGAALAAHEADWVKHVSAAERTAWNAKAAGDHTHTAAQVGAVPTTRKVNGKALSADVTLAAADVGAAAAGHSHAASGVTAGTLAGKVNANASAAGTLTAAQVRDISVGTAELTPGTSALVTGSLYFVYE